jgi:hypothetical protein
MDLGSGIREKPIPDPGSRGQKVTGSWIPDPDPQHCKATYPRIRIHTKMSPFRNTIF